jgi:hypothetical protein
MAWPRQVADIAAHDGEISLSTKTCRLPPARWGFHQRGVSGHSLRRAGLPAPTSACGLAVQRSDSDGQRRRPSTNGRQTDPPRHQNDDARDKGHPKP